MRKQHLLTEKLHVHVWRVFPLMVGDSDENYSDDTPPHPPPPEIHILVYMKFGTHLYFLVCLECMELYMDIKQLFCTNVFFLQYFKLLINYYYMPEGEQWVFLVLIS